MKRLGFNESKLLLKSKKLKTRSEYDKFISKNREYNLAKNPEAKFHDTNEWLGWDDYLCTGKINPKRIKKLTFHQAKNITKKLKIKSSAQYFEYKRKKILADNMPSDPKGVYSKDWKGFADFLGNKPTTQRRKWASFTNCRKWAKSKNFKSVDEYSNSNKPIDIPSDPSRIYKNKGWMNWTDFLGNNIQPRNTDFMPYGEAKKIVQKLNVKSAREYRILARQGKLPKLPIEPQHVYAKIRSSSK